MELRKELVFIVLNLIILSKSEIVEIADGKLEGTALKSRKGSDIYAFMKIPFAEPPVGKLRFQPPLQNKKWEGILNATSYGPICMQFSYDVRHEMSEDCLHLNVFSKNLKPKELKPVIVYIHGGGYSVGSSIDYYPDYLLDRDVVLVTINYRLGPFGFLAIGTKDAPGNMGLKDQVLALKWVQRNIAAFGGNPNLVTISGLSAGSFSVTAHVSSGMSKGLFHRAIGMSGSITYQTGLGNDGIPVAKELATSLKCSTDLDKMVSCLQTKSAAEIIIASIRYYYGCLVMPWFPVVEPDLGQERFFTEEPNSLLKKGEFNKVPIIIGITADEFIGPVYFLLNSTESLKLLNENFSEIASKCFFFKGNGVRSTDEIAAIFRKHYLPYDKIDKSSFNSLQQLCADGSIGYGVHQFAHYTSGFTDVYYYKFSYIGRFGGFNYPRDKPYGVSHGDDNQYIFAYEHPPTIKVTDPENFMVERMTRIWEHFAIFGNPNNPSDEYLSDMNWPKLDYADEYFLDIGKDMVEKQGLYLERYHVWDSLDVPKDDQREYVKNKPASKIGENVISKSWKIFTNYFSIRPYWKLIVD